MSQESEQAQEAWDLHTVRRNESIDMAVGYANGRDDYKAALKADIEKEIFVIEWRLEESQNPTQEEVYATEHEIKHLRWFLSLLDTVIPIKNG